MATPHSSLSKRVTQGYWVAVRQLLQKQYQLPSATAKRAVATYQAALEKISVGDEIYHAPIEETAEGIVTGGYVTSAGSSSSEKKARSPQTTDSRNS